MDVGLGLFPFEAGLADTSKYVAPYNLHPLHHALVYHMQYGVSVEVP